MEGSRTTRRLVGALHKRFGKSPSQDDAHVLLARAPGRVNLLGGHTDYSGGFVLPATIDRAVHVALRRRTDQAVRLYSLNFDEEAQYALAELEVTSLPRWARYVAGVAEELRRQGHTLGGFDAVIYGDVPLGAGLSSSAALEVAAAVGLDALFSLELDPVRAAKLCQRAEQEHVGVECGIMDQFASRLGQAGRALFLDCRSLEYEHVPLPLSGEACLVVADSRVSRELASSKYNERRRECEETTRFFRQFEGHIRTLRDVPERLLEERGPELPAPLFRRARHVTSENRRVEQGAELLAQEHLAEEHLEAFGRLMNASHASLRDDYEVSCAELDCLVEAAQETQGVFGARMTGAGFGGSTVTLARQDAVPRLKRAMEHRYSERFDRELETYVVERNLEAEAL